MTLFLGLQTDLKTKTFTVATRMAVNHTPLKMSRLVGFYEHCNSNQLNDVYDNVKCC